MANQPAAESPRQRFQHCITSQRIRVRFSVAFLPIPILFIRISRTRSLFASSPKCLLWLGSDLPKHVQHSRSLCRDDLRDTREVRGPEGANITLSRGCICAEAKRERGACSRAPFVRVCASDEFRPPESALQLHDTILQVLGIGRTFRRWCNDTHRSLRSGEARRQEIGRLCGRCNVP